MDATDGTQRDQRGLGLPAVASLYAARSRRQVLRIVSHSRGRRRCETTEVTGAQSQSQRFCGTLGAVSERGVFVQVDSVWRRVTASCTGRVCEAFPRREKSPRAKAT